MANVTFQNAISNSFQMACWHRQLLANWPEAEEETS